MGFIVPEDAVTALGAGKRPPVRVTINGYTYRNTVAVMGGQSMIGVNSEHRGPAKVSAGDEVEVDLELDTAPRTRPFIAASASMNLLTVEPVPTPTISPSTT